MTYEKKSGGRGFGGKGGKGGKGSKGGKSSEGRQSGRAGKGAGTGKPGTGKFGPGRRENRDVRDSRNSEERPARRFEKRGGEERTPARRFEKRGGEERTPARRFEKRGGEERAPARRFEKRGGEERAPARRFEKRGGEERAPARRFEKRGSEERSFTRAPQHSMDEAPKRGALGLKPEREKKAFVPHEFFIWGRRPVETYLAELTSQETQPEAKDHKLHIIVDKAGKAPSQLRTIVELTKSFGFPVVTHKNDEGEWPVAGEEGLNHQRVCLRVPAIKQFDVHDLAALVTKAKADGVQGCVGVICDQVQDPRNFGAILRSAAFFGLQFAVFGKDRQALITPHVLKASAGGAFQLKLAEVVNIVRAMEILKNAGAWIVGTALENSVPLSTIPLDRPYVVVMGNEGKGLRQDVARHCDYLARIEGGVGPVDSLNVAVAAGIVFHGLKAAAPEVSE
jgi:23S rRNA (guanosine2251-2'-O)-methyltransferase